MIARSFRLPSVCAALAFAGMSAACSSESASASAPAAAPPSGEQNDAGDTACHSVDCLTLTTAQAEHAKDLRTFVDKLAATTGSFVDLGADADAIWNDAVVTLAAGGDDDASYYRAARQVLTSFRDGHIDMYSATKCSSAELPELFTSRLGACTQPYRDHAVVAYAESANALGLRPGDRITAVDGRAGQAMLDAAFAHPFCGVSSASDSNRRFAAATSLLSALRVGSTIEVTHTDGTVETKTVKKLESPTMCRFPTAGDHAYPAKTTLRSDGIAVVEVPSFLLPRGMKENDLAQAIGAELDKAKGAKGIVWDLRGNPGGATLVALSIIGGMPGFQSGTVAKCATRKAGSAPFVAVTGSEYPLRLSPNSRFSVGNKVAVLVDGLTTSAGDYFARAIATMTSGKVPIVGATTAGAWGGVGQVYEFGKSPALMFSADETRCTDPDGRPMERSGIDPTIPIELDPADLAAGRDTVLEAAVAAVR